LHITAAVFFDGHDHDGELQRQLADQHRHIEQPLRARHARGQVLAGLEAVHGSAHAVDARRIDHERCQHHARLGGAQGQMVASRRHLDRFHVDGELRSLDDRWQKIRGSLHQLTAERV
jgi:hypothetical protein